MNIDAEAAALRLSNAADLAAVARRLGVAPDWHEPDSQEVRAMVHGAVLENGVRWPVGELNGFRAPEVIAQQDQSGLPWEARIHTPSDTHMYATILQEDRPVAQVNLAALCAWATAGATAAPATPAPPGPGPDLVPRVESRGELAALVQQLGIRPDWHRLHAQDVTGTVRGVSFDNAGSWPLSEATAFMSLAEIREYPGQGLPNHARTPTPPHAEMHLTVHQNAVPRAHINLATLFMMAEESVIEQQAA